LHQLGLGEHAKKSARCPFHDDQRNSFSVWKKDGAWFFKCHAGCGEGDEINFLELLRHLSRRDATGVFLEMAGLNGSTWKAAFTSLGVRQRVITAGEDKEERPVIRLAEVR
jgi:DNA primase